MRGRPLEWADGACHVELLRQTERGAKSSRASILASIYSYVISTYHRRDDIVPSSLCLCVHFPCHSGRARAAGGSTVQYGRATSTMRARDVDIVYLLHATGTLPLAMAKCERCEPWPT